MDLATTTAETAHRRRMASPEAQQQLDSSSQCNTDYASMMESSNDGLLRIHNSAPVVVQAESHTRSLLKGLTWRLLATTTTTVIAYWITGHVEAALQIGAMEFLAKLGIYYAHERLWTHIRI